MKKVAVRLLAYLIALGMIAGIAFVALATPSEGVLVLGTWNVRGYPETTPDRSAWFTSTLSTLGLDVLCVQEIANQDRVNTFLNTEASFSTVAFNDSSDGMDNAIFFANGIYVEDIPDPAGFQHPAQEAYFRYQGLDAVIITIHLSWTDRAKRAAERQLLIGVVQQALQKDPDVIVIGDFNATGQPRDTISGLATSLGLEVLQLNNPTVGTTYTGHTYDYILVSPDLYDEEAIGSHIPAFTDEQTAQAVSDHRPVIAFFSTDQAYADSGTPPKPPTPPSLPLSNVQITRIFYDGVVPRVESDEYVEITNLGQEAQDLLGWKLVDVSEGYPEFRFASSYVLAPGATIRIYTNEIHPEWGGFSFRSGKAIWNNKDPDTAVLYNSQGQEVSRKSY